MRAGWLGSMTSLNPFIGINDVDYFFYGLIYDYLFAIDEDQRPLPNLAVSATPDASGFNWTYVIRQGVTWSDGTPFTADDVVFTFEYNTRDFGFLWAYEPYVNRICSLDKARAGGYCQTLYNQGLAGVERTGPWEVTIRFDAPFAIGEFLMVPIIPQHIWQNININQAQYFYANLNPVGTGVFIGDADIGTRWSAGQSLRLHRNANYHLGPTAIENLEIILYPDETSMIIGIQRNPPEIDLGVFSSNGYRALAGKPNIDRAESLITTQYWTEIGFQQLDAPGVNNKLNPVRWDENVRRALAMATNKTYVVNNCYDGAGVEGSTLVSPVTPEWHYEPTGAEKFAFDKARANQLLDASGYAARDIDGVRIAGPSAPSYVPAGKRLDLTMATRLAAEFPGEVCSAEQVVRDWADVGVQLTFQSVEETTLSNLVYNGDVDTYIWYWSGDPEPNYLLSIESGFTLDGWNDNYWDNASFNQEYLAYLSSFDRAERAVHAKAAQKIHYDSAVYIVLVYPYGQWAWRTDRFSGWGDWVAHPGRQVNAFWTAHPLFFDLRPPGSPTVSADAATGRPNQVVTITGRIQDTVSGTWYLTFGDGAVTGGTYAAGTTPISESHTYPTDGTYVVTLSAENGIANVTSRAEAVIQAVGNLAPTNAALIADRTSGPPGTRVNFTLSARDAEGGTLTFSIDFGDGSRDSASRTAAANATATATFSHVYADAGNYRAEANVSDGQLVTQTPFVDVTIQSPVPPTAPLDIVVLTSIGLVVVAAVGGIGYLLWRRGKTKEPETPPPPPPPPPTQ